MLVATADGRRVAEPALKAFVFGAGAHGRIVADILHDRGGWEIFFVDDDPTLCGSQVNATTIVGALADIARRWDESSRMVIALGHPVARVAVAERAARLGVRFTNAIHPSAVIASTASRGEGDMISAGALINSNAVIGNHVIINTAAVIEHDTIIDNGATVCPCACIGGRVSVGPGAFISSGALLLPRVRIGAGAIVAAGATVTKDVDARTLVMGAPARVVGQVEDNFNWSRVL